MPLTSCWRDITAGYVHSVTDLPSYKYWHYEVILTTRLKADLIRGNFELIIVHGFIIVHYLTH